MEPGLIKVELKQGTEKVEPPRKPHHVVQREKEKNDQISKKNAEQNTVQPQPVQDVNQCSTSKSKSSVQKVWWKRPLLRLKQKVFKKKLPTSEMEPLQSSSVEVPVAVTPFFDERDLNSTRTDQCLTDGAVHSILVNEVQKLNADQDVYGQTVVANATVWQMELPSDIHRGTPYEEDYARQAASIYGATVVTEHESTTRPFQRVLIPICLSNHWSMGVLDVNFKQIMVYDSIETIRKSLMTYDSRKQVIQARLPTIAHHLLYRNTGIDVPASQFHVRFVSAAYQTQQTDGVNCGVYAIYNAISYLQKTLGSGERVINVQMPVSGKHELAAYCNRLRMGWRQDLIAKHPILAKRAEIAFQLGSSPKDYWAAAAAVPIHTTLRNTLSHSTKTHGEPVASSSVNTQSVPVDSSHKFHYANFVATTEQRVGGKEGLQLGGGEENGTDGAKKPVSPKLLTAVHPVPSSSTTVPIAALDSPKPSTPTQPPTAQTPVSGLRNLSLGSKRRANEPVTDSCETPKRHRPENLREPMSPLAPLSPLTFSKPVAPAATSSTSSVHAHYVDLSVLRCPDDLLHPDAIVFESFNPQSFNSLQKNKWISDSALSQILLGTLHQINSVLLPMNRTVVAESTLWNRPFVLNLTAPTEQQMRSFKNSSAAVSGVQPNAQGKSQFGRALLPVCINEHWSLAIVTQCTKSILVYDSLPGYRTDPGRQAILRKWVPLAAHHMFKENMQISILPELFKLEFVDSSHQSEQLDGTNCGVYVIHNALTYLEKVPRPEDQTTIPADLHIPVNQTHSDLIKYCNQLRARWRQELTVIYPQYADIATTVFLLGETPEAYENVTNAITGKTATVLFFTLFLCCIVVPDTDCLASCSYQNSQTGSQPFNNRGCSCCATDFHKPPSRRRFSRSAICSRICCRCEP
ncbi:hypothetical protein L596_027089 [Steinernema carpocapsae]|uniref:Ubiquitin-like protease family profile domain-containing protein n=1 Tax=Steinernema carpocapsae TaxID=34508 RepID=A0A4U5M3D4_STECR|nr:hypothetical protein L596_027089 [Steinernema carpocapsae]